MEGSSDFDNGGNILFCRKCGGRLLPDALFCVRCGERVKIAAQAAQPVQTEPPPSRPAPPSQAEAFPLPSGQPALAARPWQPDQGMPTKTAAAPYPSALADAKREKKPPAPRKPMKPWLMVLLSAVGSFVVFGTVVLVVLSSLMK